MTGWDPVGWRRVGIKGSHKTGLIMSQRASGSREIQPSSAWFWALKNKVTCCRERGVGADTGFLSLLKQTTTNLVPVCTMNSSRWKNQFGCPVFCCRAVFLREPPEANQFPGCLPRALWVPSSSTPQLYHSKFSPHPQHVSLSHSHAPAFLFHLQGLCDYSGPT